MARLLPLLLSIALLASLHTSARADSLQPVESLTVLASEPADRAYFTIAVTPDGSTAYALCEDNAEYGVVLGEVALSGPSSGSLTVLVIPPSDGYFETVEYSADFSVAYILGQVQYGESDPYYTVLWSAALTGAARGSLTLLVNASAELDYTVELCALLETKTASTAYLAGKSATLDDTFVIWTVALTGPSAGTLTPIAELALNGYNIGSVTVAADGSVAYLIGAGRDH